MYRAVPLAQTVRRRKPPGRFSCPVKCVWGIKSIIIDIRQFLLAVAESVRNVCGRAYTQAGRLEAEQNKKNPRDQTDDTDQRRART
jgi:hypothetical protein